MLAIGACQAILPDSTESFGQYFFADATNDYVRWLNDIDLATRESLRLCADPAAHCFPDSVVTVFDTGNGVGDFMENGVLDFVFIVKSNEMPGQLDRLFFFNSSETAFPLPDLCAAELFLAVRPTEFPAIIGDAMVSH